MLILAGFVWADNYNGFDEDLLRGLILAGFVWADNYNLASSELLNFSILAGFVWADNYNEAPAPVAVEQILAGFVWADNYNIAVLNVVKELILAGFVWADNYNKSDLLQSAKPPVTLTGNKTGIIGRVEEELAQYLPGQKAGDINLSGADFAHAQEHLEQIQNLGFKTVEDFSQHVLGNLDAVHPKSGRALGFVSKRTEPWGQMVVDPPSASPSGLYETRTTFPIGRLRFKNKSPLWERALPSGKAEADHFTGAGETPYAISGQSGLTDNISQPPAFSNGFGPEQFANFQRAKQLRTAQGQKFESGANAP